MHKRTKGYTLLLLLVLTGLAGRLSTTTITNQERRFLIDQLKESRAAVQKTVEGLSEKQWNFKPAPEKWSIKECLQHIVLTESYWWNRADALLKQQANSDKKLGSKIKDQEILTILSGKDQKLQASENFKSLKNQWKSAEEILDAFKRQRNSMIKYAKTSTDDMRNYVLKMPVGNMDAYQMLLYIPAYTKRQTLQIEEIKADPAFPK